jgi:hypothetical protein
MPKRCLILCGCALALLALPACDKDEFPSAPPQTTEVRPPTPDQLIQLFMQAWRERDHDLYRQLIHEDFLFRFLQRDVDEFVLPSDHLVRDEELAVAEAMMRGDPGVHPVAGYTVAGISDINFELFDREGVWGDTDDPVDFPGSTRAIYNLQATFLRPGSTNMIVQGQAIFYAIRCEEDVNGRTVSFYRLQGWVDRSLLAKGTESFSWGYAKALYREATAR